MKKSVWMLAFVLLATIIISSCGAASNAKDNRGENDTVYTCLPCGSDCDKMIYSKPGSCSHCDMQLVDSKTIVHKNIQPEEMCSLNEKDVIFLDVRTPEEFNGTARDKFGAIRNAVNIPVQELEKRINELVKYKDKEIVVYCSHCHRSPRASYMLTQNGFANVTNMQGGMSVWKERVKDAGCNESLYINQ
jgi:rhodanese-related sulfurtransferase